MPVLLSTPANFTIANPVIMHYIYFQTLHVVTHFIKREQLEKIKKGARCNKDEFPLTASHLNIGAVTYFLTCRLMTVFSP